ncbi:hypothetical protein ACHQM5_028479 [Ranunculus cassubicifolius]
MEQAILTEKSLPQDVLIDILVRLPADLLTTLRHNSKALGTFFSNDSQFVKSHWENSIPKIIALGSVKRDSDEIASLYIAKNIKSCDHALALKRPPFEVLKSYIVCGMSHGVLSLIDRAESWHRHRTLVSDVYLWNPLTKEKFIIQCPPIPCHFPINSDDCRVVFGFGFLQDATTFKVLRLLYVPAVTYCSTFAYRSREFRSHVSLYNVCTASWKNLPDLSTEIRNINPLNPVEMVNDCLHWVAAVSNDIRILAFNIKEETFQLMPTPISTRYSSLHVTKLRGQLCIFDNPPPSWQPPNYTAGYLELWVMKEYGVNHSWTKLLKIEGSFEQLMPQGVAKNGQLILKKHTEISSWGPIHELVQYNEKTEVLSHIKKFEKPFEFIQPFKESLISIRSMQKEAPEDQGPSERE